VLQTSQTVYVLFISVSTRLLLWCITMKTCATEQPLNLDFLNSIARLYV
jgi:hypothetical protein